jgi:hypothetical protein
LTRAWPCLVACAIALVATGSASALDAPSGLAYSDLVAAPEVFDPQFSWSRVSGAAGYEVEVNYSSSWASGSKVCCDALKYGSKITTYGTLFSPPVVLANNTYYWRVRAIDANDVAGPWRAGPPFDKTFDNVTPSVPNLRLADSDLNTLPVPSNVDTPIVLWDQVPGAASYQVGVAPFQSGQCNWSASLGTRWDSETTVTGWTPLGSGRSPSADPLQSGRIPKDDQITGLQPGWSYCVRVRPVDLASAQYGGPVVYGDWTHLPANNSPAFTWNAPPASTIGDCNPCNADASTYVQPMSGETSAKMPVFTWNPIAGAESYFVVVAHDAAFTNIVDYAYTRVAAYAPREHSQTRTYPDETTEYYWAILPADRANGDGVSATAATSEGPPFVKATPSPSLLSPTAGATVNVRSTTFRWSPVLGARRYRVQVSDDPTFANIFREGASSSGFVTDSTAYTSSSDYPTGKTLYWRVQAEADDATCCVGLRWSPVGTFTRTWKATATLKRFRLSARGYPVKNRWRTIKIYVKDRATLRPVYRATVTASGAGVKRTTKRTTTTGVARFYLKATQLGRVTFRVSKRGYMAASISRNVRLP